jgi:hypothetical protein
MTTWTRSSFCKADQPMCAEVQRCHAGEIHLRSSRDPSHYVHLTNDEWVAFVAGVKDGQFDDVQ